ncbi:MAG: hypothetical protein HY332_02130 [Chloroflexi bacterium]|nr:hypothetical protein [Chloroflexota bacterium]
MPENDKSMQSQMRRVPRGGQPSEAAAPASSSALRQLTKQLGYAVPGFAERYDASANCRWFIGYTVRHGIRA